MRSTGSLFERTHGEMRGALGADGIRRETGGKGASAAATTTYEWRERREMWGADGIWRETRGKGASVAATTAQERNPRDREIGRKGQQSHAQCFLRHFCVMQPLPIHCSPGKSSSIGKAKSGHRNRTSSMREAYPENALISNLQAAIRAKERPHSTTFKLP